MKRTFDRVYQFELVLQGIEPPIWRRIQVPATYSFWDLHVAIQDAMGWADYHLHAFEMPNPATGQLETIGIPDEELLDELPTLPGWETPIARYFSPSNPLAGYLYDFGDGWQHAVTLEEIVPRDRAVRYPICLAGERRCPPEDVGGEGGYEEFLRIISDPQDEEHESMLEWVGGSFDPEAFDPAQVCFEDPQERWKRAFAER